MFQRDHIIFIFIGLLAGIQSLCAGIVITSQQDAEKIFKNLHQVIEQNNVKATIAREQPTNIVDNALKATSSQNVAGYMYTIEIGKIVEKIPQFNTVIYEGKITFETDIEKKFKSLHIKVNKNALETKKSFYLLMKMIAPEGNNTDWENMLNKIIELPDSDLETLPVKLMADFYLDVTYSTISKDVTAISFKIKK